MLGQKLVDHSKNYNEIKVAENRGYDKALKEFASWLWNLPRPVTTFANLSVEEALKEFKDFNRR